MTGLDTSKDLEAARDLGDILEVDTVGHTLTGRIKMIAGSINFVLNLFHRAQNRTIGCYSIYPARNEQQPEKEFVFSKDLKSFKAQNLDPASYALSYYFDSSCKHEGIRNSS
ncbi:hypothetical protein PVAG01_07412 [Phlyctema vagabunda]|uniref:Uncharacterized protein n=1 Tax=Phlyctema vagabunda TaxID=108571 RepID=A0ABR4PCT0_9HELO